MNRLDKIWISFLAISALLGGMLLASLSPYMVIIIPAAFIVGVFLLSSKEACLFISILILPVLGSNVLSTPILPVPGARISNMLLVVALIGFLINSKLDFSEVKPGVLFYAGSILLLLTAAMRSGHVARYSIEFWEESYTPVKFFISHGVIQALRSVPFLMIIAAVRSRVEINRVTKYMAISMILFSLTIMGIYFLGVPTGSDFQTTRDIIAEHLGMHGNNLADFLIVGFPVMLSLSLDPKNPHKKWFYLAVILSLIATAMTYSRAAYFIVVLAVLLIILLTKNYRLVVPMVVVMLLITTLMPTVVDRALTGFDTRDADDFTAGRTDMIWRAVIRDIEISWSTAPEKIVFGYGRYGIMDLRDFKNQRMIRTNQAHNMYLDTLLNSGIVGLIFYLFFFIWLIVRLVTCYVNKKMNSLDEQIYLLTGLLVSIVSFLIRGFTDSFFLPQLSNAYMYIVVAIAFVMLRKGYIKKSGKENFQTGGNKYVHKFDTNVL